MHLFTQLTDTAQADGYNAGLILGSVVSYVLYGYLTGRILRKAGLPMWIGFVPVYNQWKLFEMGGRAGWWAILLLVPIVNIVAIVVMFTADYRIAKGFQKPGAFVLLAIFLRLVFFLWLAFDKSTWEPETGTTRLRTPLATGAHFVTA